MNIYIFKLKITRQKIKSVHLVRTAFMLFDVVSSTRITDALVDPEYGISVNAVKLRRVVQEDKQLGKSLMSL